MLIESTSVVIEKNKGGGGGGSRIGKKEKNLNEGQRKKMSLRGQLSSCFCGSLSVDLPLFLPLSLCHTPVSHLHFPRQPDSLHGLVSPAFLSDFSPCISTSILHLSAKLAGTLKMCVREATGQFSAALGSLR